MMARIVVLIQFRLNQWSSSDLKRICFSIEVHWMKLCMWSGKWIRFRLVSIWYEIGSFSYRLFVNYFEVALQRVGDTEMWFTYRILNILLRLRLQGLIRGLVGAIWVAMYAIGKSPRLKASTCVLNVDWNNNTHRFDWYFSSPIFYKAGTFINCNCCAL